MTIALEYKQKTGQIHTGNYITKEGHWYVPLNSYDWASICYGNSIDIDLLAMSQDIQKLAASSASVEEVTEKIKALLPLYPSIKMF